MNRRPAPSTMPVPAVGRRRRGRRGLGPIAVVAVLGLLVALVLCRPDGSADAQTRASSAPDSTSKPPSSKAPVTPVFSSRRVPDLLRSRIADEQVAKVVTQATKDQPPTSCVVITDRGRVVHDLNGPLPMIPASLTKLVTGSAALKILGPDTRLTTSLKGPAVAPGGVVNGDVFLVGGGDPLLYTHGFQQTREYRDQPFNDFNQLADALKAAGITQINGNIVGDESRYDTQRGIPTWEPNYQKDEQVGALSALQVNWGEVGLERDPNKTSRARRLGDPPVMAAATLETLLEQRGIRVSGQGVSGQVPPVPALTELARLDSFTVRQLVDEMNSFSDNNTAELLTKEMGLKTANQGTTAAGIAAIMSYLKEAGLPTEGVSLVDGSGLDRNDRLTCNLVAALLDKQGPDSDLAHSMAVFGQKGTLQKRKSLFADGRVTAKTGTLKEVVALAGFEKTNPGSIVTFVSIQNGNSVPGIKVQDDLINGLLAYPQAPDLTAMSPKPLQ